MSIDYLAFMKHVQRENLNESISAGLALNAVLCPIFVNYHDGLNVDVPLRIDPQLTPYLSRILLHYT
jgi:hypothetical protein